ncbi:MAG: copper homeostasis protein CutC [Saprospiraceae bacterium]|nr:copper homeostasis protein CutC [Saprospiraceae bacterium]
MTKTRVLEACIETKLEAVNAAMMGANQLEVCSTLSEDGLTPETNTLCDILSSVKVPCKVMIRSRPGNFYYSHEEVVVMIDQIQQLKAYKIEGFVFGALTKDANGVISIDMKAVYQLCKAASPLHVTIHKAIDQCSDILTEIDRLQQISNIRFVLSSGGKETAALGADMLLKMKEKAGTSLHIIAAGSITPENIEAVATDTGISYFHGRRILGSLL